MKRFLVFLVICSLVLTACTITFRRPIGEWKCEDPQIIVWFPASTDENHNHECTLFLDGEEYSIEASYRYAHDLSTVYFGSYVEPEITHPDNPDYMDVSDDLVIQFRLVGKNIWGEIISSIYEDYPEGTILKFTFDGEGDYYERY